MTTPDYQGNWRGARRYRFDEEAKLKKAARKRAGRKSSPLAWLKSLPLFPVALLLIGAAGIAFSGSVIPLDQVKAMLPGSGCNIKGNIRSGERIYHVSGQRYYEETSIAPHFGERWFCSESQARSAGWRKSKV